MSEQKVSNYTTDDLPTWGEIWEQFWLNKVFFYDPLDPAHNVEGMTPNTNPEELLNREDPYWKMPHRMLLLGWVANQFNKMLFEDGCIEKIAPFLRKRMDKPEDAEIDMVFFLQDDDSLECPHPMEMNPMVYFVTRPNGERHFLATKHPSINMGDLKGKIFLAISIMIEDAEFIYPVNEGGIGEDIVVELLKTPYGSANESIWKYYEGTIGFKDEHGEVMESEAPQRRGCVGSGMDAAL